MLVINKMSDTIYNMLSKEEKETKDSLFLIENSATKRCSIYVGGKCYGEDIDEDAIDAKIQSIEDEYSYTLASNSDILNILNS